MTKFYTLLAAAAIAMPAVAGNLQANKAERNLATSEIETATVADFSNFTVDPEIAAKALKSTRADYPAVAGEYFGTFYQTIWVGNHVTIAQPYSSMPQYVTFSNFLDGWLNTMEFSGLIQDVQFSNGTYQCLVVTNNTPIGSDGTNTYGLWLCDDTSIYSNDIPFLITDSGLYIAYADCYLGYYYKTGETSVRGAKLLGYDGFYTANGEMKYGDYDFDTQGLTATSCPVYAYQYQSSLYVLGFTDAEGEVEFVIDGSNSTATATNQIGEVGSWFGLTNNFIWVNENLDPVINATVTNTSDNTSKLTVTDGMNYCYSEGAGSYVAIAQAELTFNFALEGLASGDGDDDLDPSGIEDLESDLNAAPEFFNLQGVKVANPENGIYLKVVNGKASKVVVK